MLTTTAMGEREEEEEDGKVRVDGGGESRLHRLIRTLSTAEWVSQTRVMVRMGRERERDIMHLFISSHIRLLMMLICSQYPLTVGIH